MSGQTQPPSAPHQPWTENPSEEWMHALEHLNTGQYELAVKHCLRAIEIWPDYYNAWMLMSRAHEHMGHTDEALEAVQRAAEIAIEELGQAWNAQAFLHIARREFQDALTMDRVLDLVDPTRHSATRYRMGIAHVQLGDKDEGLKCLAEALRFHPELREKALSEPLLESVYAELESLLPEE